MTLPLNNAFENNEKITLGQTTSKKYTVYDENNNPLKEYEIFYKPVVEFTLDWQEIEHGTYDFKSQLEDNETLEWNNEEYRTVVKEGHTNPMGRESRVFNIENYRKLLKTKIKVKKLSGTYYYDKGSQGIVDVPTQINGIRSFTYDTERVKSIQNPWVFDPIDNERLSDIIPLSHIIVLPYITDSDVSDGYIQFLDESETISEWKRNDPLIWTKNTTYVFGDVLFYENNYYRVIADVYTSGPMFKYDTKVLEKLTVESVKTYLPPKYFPTMDLFYAVPNTNLANQKSINAKEKVGYYWCRPSRLVFWQLIFEPLYNKNIDNIAIKLYNPNNTDGPEFHLI